MSYRCEHGVKDGKEECYQCRPWTDVSDSELRIKDLQRKLEIAVKCLEFYAERDNYDREGVLYADSEYTVDYGYKAGQALKVLGEK